MALNDAFKDVEGHGSAEVYTPYGEHGTFYSHQYDAEGRQDVMGAAKAYITTQTEGAPALRAVALLLLEEGGVQTDLYQRQSNERWYLNADNHLNKARRIIAALQESAADLLKEPS